MTRADYRKQSPSEKKFSAIWELAGDAMVFVDADGLLDCNDAALRLLGIESRDQAIGLPLHAFAPPAQADGRASAQVFADGRLRVLESGLERFDWQFQRADGTPLLLDVIMHPVQMGGGEIVHAILRDVTVQRLAAREVEIARLTAESSLRHLSRQDAITGLPNRSLFLEEGQRRLAAAHPPDRVCVFCIDVDNFRRVNEVLGTKVGDDALRAVGERLRRFVGASELLARVGSDEFALLLTDCTAEAAAEMARRFVAEQEHPFTVGDEQFSVTVSVGVACLATGATGLEGLIQRATTAMHVARHNGQGGWAMFAESMTTGMRDRWYLENELRTALARSQFVVHYQPQVALHSNRIVGVEALLRWNNPRLGVLEPDSFIALAEEIGLIESIGEWVLFEACRQCQHWLANCSTAVTMSVNLAARQFQRGLPTLVRAALADAHLAPHRLTLEMTEGTLMDGSNATIDILSELRDQGISLAIDDFGTGYSSLSYLRRFPLDHLKIDQSFVQDIDRDPNSLAIVGAIINLGHTLRLSVIAEGVDSRAQLDLLRQYRCDQAQGFHFARALPAADVGVLLDRSAAYFAGSTSSTR